MHFLIAPDKFKDALSAQETAEAIRIGILEALPTASTSLLPLADGGEGTAAILTRLNKGRWQETSVAGPLGEKVKASWGYAQQEKEAYIELASASGLQLLSPKDRNPLHTSTRGTGEQIKAALEAGAEKIILGLGGSATNDGGTGMAAALGFRFLNKEGQLIKNLCGKSLQEIRYIDTSQANPLLKNCQVRAACDVQNLLLGPTGATYTFAGQKGAKAEDLLVLEEGMGNLARLFANDLGKDIHHLIGGGAAGGAGAGAFAFLNARLEGGAELILQSSSFRQQLQQADWVITGEGHFDETSLGGKVSGMVCEWASLSGKPVLVICGSRGITPDHPYPLVVKEIIAVSAKEKDLSSALQNTRKNLIKYVSQYFSSKK